MSHADFMLVQLGKTVGTMVFDEVSVLGAIKKARTTGGIGTHCFPEHGEGQYTIIAILSYTPAFNEFHLFVTIFQGQSRPSNVRLTLTTTNGVATSLPTSEGQSYFPLGATPEALIGAHLNLTA